MWKHLAHPNIVPLFGITPVPLQLISEWIPGGDLTEYVKNHPETDRLGLVGTTLLLCLTHAYFRHKLSDVTSGLYYLHSCNIVHGDLKGVSYCPESGLPGVDTRPAKHPRGRCWLCTDHGLRSCHSHSKP